MKNFSMDLTGKICLVTGANSGIGKATSLGLAHLGATVVMVCRDRMRGEAALAEIKRQSGNDNITLLIADLSSQADIRQLAEAFRSKFAQLHILINNAGLIVSKRQITIDGIEYTFAVNHLAYFLLTNLLLDRIIESAPTARILNVSSGAHYRGKIDFNDLQGEMKYSQIKAYSQSKLANIFFTYELAKKLRGSNVSVNAYQPGAVRTNFGRSGSKLFGLMVKVLWPFMRSAKNAGNDIVHLVTSPELQEVTGKLFEKKTEKRSSEISYDEEISHRLWNISEEMTSSNH